MELIWSFVIELEIPPNQYIFSSVDIVKSVFNAALPLYTICFKREYLNAVEDTDVIVSGIVISVNFEQPENALSPIVVILL